MNNFHQLLFICFLTFSCAKKPPQIAYNDVLSNALEEALNKPIPKFDKIGSLSNYTNEFNQRFKRLYRNQSFIKKINFLLADKNFLEAKNTLQKQIILSGKTPLTNLLIKLFENAEAIENYKSLYPFEDKVENSRAISRLQTQTKEFKTNSIFSLWLVNEKQKLKKRVNRENQIIYSNLQLYNNIMQTEQQNQYNTAILLASYLLPQSPESKLNKNEMLITLENPLTEKRWLELHSSANNSKDLQQLLNTITPITLSNLLTRIEYSLANKQYKKAIKHIQTLLDTKLISKKTLARIIQKYHTVSLPDSIISINSLMAEFISF